MLDCLIGYVARAINGNTGETVIFGLYLKIRNVGLKVQNFDRNQMSII